MPIDPSLASLLFVSRKGRGKGGMQTLHADLLRGFQSMDGVTVRHYVSQGIFFPFVALWHCMRAAYRGEHIHLGDAALAPFGKLVKVLFPKTPVTLTACGLDVIYPNRLYQWLMKRTLPSLDCIVCISHATAEAVNERGVPTDHSMVIPCGVWPSDCKVGSESQKKNKFPILLSVGRLIPRKGILWFVDTVLPKLLDSYPDLQYWIVGDGPERKRIESTINTKGLRDSVRCSVRFLGEVDDPSRDACIDQADIFIMPNREVKGDMEGFGIVCIEASARGIPVVAARMEGIADAVKEGETGALFLSGNTEDCVTVLQKMLTHPLHKKEVAEHTQEYYAWPQLIDRYRDEVFHF